MILTPNQIAKDSEESHQVAAMAFFAIAKLHGFKVAWDWNDNGKMPVCVEKYSEPIPELRWLHHTPNGGSRGDTALTRSQAGGAMKAAGAKSGIPDFFWPLFRGSVPGLYIELKNPSLFRANKLNNGCSQNQLEFGVYARERGYGWMTCYSWREVCQQYEIFYNWKH